MNHSARSALLAFLLAAGARAQEAAAPLPSNGVDFAGLNVITRILDQTYPSGDAPLVTLANRFGPIHVEAWDDAVVHLTITIRAGAATEDGARRAAESIDIAATREADKIEVRTVFPPSNDSGVGGYAVDYAVHVPRQTAVTIENTFGDSIVRDVKGGTMIDSRYGAIDLTDLSGPVRVRARGEFPLTAKGLENGGYFSLRGTQASLDDVKGTLRVSNYLGSVTLHGLRVDEADVVAESGPIHLYLPEGPSPRIRARVDFGRIESEVALNRNLWGRSELAELDAPGATQRVSVHASFDNVYIYRPASLAPLLESTDGSELVRDDISETVALLPDQTLRIDAAAGNVTLEGTADDQVTVTASRHARVRDVANARLVLEGLSLRIENEGPVLHILSLVQEDMAALGSDDYGIDLTIRCPANTAIQLYADDGDSHVVRLSGVVDVEQGAGSLNASQLSGRATLTNFRGAVSVEDSSGSITVNATAGDARIQRVSGDTAVTVENGKTVIDTPGGALTVRASGGDVRIVALDGVNGDYDIHVEDGNLGFVAPDTASATLFMNASNGVVRSSVPATGTMERGNYQFEGRLNEGRYRVLLETLGGDIQVD